jgi:uncharacterized protein YjbJ (UPF0337 family)
MGDKKDRAKGQVKEKVGRATRSPGLEQKGRDQQTKGNVKASAKKAKDAVKKQT